MAQTANGQTSVLDRVPPTPAAEEPDGAQDTQETTQMHETHQASATTLTEPTEPTPSSAAASTATVAAPAQEPLLPAEHLGVEVHRDMDRAERAAAEFLDALGVDHSTAHLRETPKRMAKAWAEMLTAREFDATVFPNDEGYDELVIARDIPFRAVCEHHMLPFVGTACVAYLPGDQILGLSKLARIVEHYACRPQTQERLTRQVALWLEEHLHPKAVGVVLKAEHSCMTLRGVRATGSSTVTSSLLGSLRSDARSRQEFLALAGVGC